jgi:hypothetical protein
VTAAGILVPESRIRTNLFCALVGDVETGKTTAIKWALCKLGLAEQKGRDIESGKLVYELKSGSVEGLAKLFQKEQVKGGARLLFPDELSHLMDKGQLQGAASVLQTVGSGNTPRMAAAGRLVKRPGFFVEEGFPRGPACDPVLLRTNALFDALPFQEEPLSSSPDTSTCGRQGWLDL